MKEENKGASKNKWSRIFKKKWFFPGLYLTLAALLVAGVIWFQAAGNDEVAEDNMEQDPSYDQTSEHPEEDAEPVMGPDEVIEMPVASPDEAEIVTKFYDYDADEEEQLESLILYNNRYYQSTGLDIASSDGETFDVVASLSGTVSEVKEDPLLGNLVVLDHGDDVATYYASLGEVQVQAGDEVSQGDVIGTAGKNLFGQDNGTHVHFELRKNGQEVNPEAYFNQPVASLDNLAEDVMENEAEEEEASSEEEADPSNADSSDLLNDLSGIENPDETEEEEDEAAEQEEDEDAVDEEEDAQEDEIETVE